jgi:hypothetical protein
MKIQLERKLNSCSHKLACTVCNQWFEVGKIRALLYNSEGFLLGDVCPECVKLPAPGIRSRLRERASLLLQQAELSETLMVSARDRALELLQAAQEEVKYPSLLDWWFKKFQVMSEESYPIESTQIGETDLYLVERSRLQKMLEDDRE